MTVRRISGAGALLSVRSSWQCVGVSDISTDLPQEPSGWVTLPDVAERLDVPVTKVHQMIREGDLLAVRHRGVRYVPAELVADPVVTKHLPGLLTLLRDAGMTDRKPCTGCTPRTSRCRGHQLRR
jgi:hypothetical protein